MQSKIILGIDPGIANLGYGVISCIDREITHVAHGAIKTDKSLSLPQRLGEISLDIKKLLELYNPEIVTIEEFFLLPNQRNTNSLNMPMSIGSILATVNIFNSNIDILMYHPRKMKMDITGYGSCSKRDIQDVVQNILSLEKYPTPNHAADALALAICGARQEGSF